MTDLSQTNNSSSSGFFTGRLNRTGFLIRSVALLIPALFLNGIERAVPEIGAIPALIILALGILQLVFVSRRLRDMGRNPLLVLIFLIPIVSIFAFIWAAVTPSEQPD